MRYMTQNNNLSADALLEARLLLELDLRKCTTCLQFKTTSEFQRAKLGIGGFACVCKVCSSKCGKDYRDSNKDGVLFRVNRAILKKQRYETHVCWIADKSAHVAAAHLLGEFGLLSDEDSREFRSIYMLNLPERLAKLEKERVDSIQTATLKKQKRDAEQQERDAARTKQRTELTTVSASLLKAGCAVNVVIEDLLYSRMRHHLKKKRRSGNAGFAFTKVNFESLTGYSISQLREHLEHLMPNGASWIDFVNGDLHIEHLMPSAAYDLHSESGIRNCYAMSNLTLLAASTNAAKGGSTDKRTVAHFKDDVDSARLFGLVQ